ncbi:MAG TPA: Hint domain-containing protein [Alphaproteobacteria bacterium]|nr:Hint domain-containing protein [Alphaproteobacteria bacterium]
MTTDQITGTYAHGITLSSDSFASPVTVTGTASVVGQTTGIYAGTDWTVVNQGTIATDGTFTGVGVALQDGGAVTNTSGGYILGLGTGVRITGAAGAVDNAGSISALNRYGVELDSGTIDNHANARIAGYRSAIAFDSGPGTVSNSGTLEATAPGGRAVLMYTGGTITNDAGGLISAGASGLLIGGDAPTQTSLVDNAGTIIGASNVGVRISGHGVLTNELSGEIAGNQGVVLFGSGLIENAGTIAGVAVGVAVSSSYVTLINSGTISGYEGASLSGASGLVTNSASGSISGIAAKGVSWTIENAGTIGSATTQVPDGMGGYTTIASYGVSLGADAAILFNESGGRIDGGKYGVISTGANSTIENAGTISGGTDAVYLADGFNNRLIVDAGAVFDGSVVAATIVSGSTPTNVLELSGQTGPGSISDIGSEFTGFQTVTIDAGATWTVGSITAAVTVVNAGTVQASAAAYSAGIALDAGGAVTNQIGGVISGTYTDIRIGTRDHLVGGTVDNAGSLSGGQPFGVLAYGDLHLTNEATGTIGGLYGAVAVGLSATIANDGLITGGSYGTGMLGGGYGIEVDGDLSLTNTTTGTILTNGVGISFGASATHGTIDNAGTIFGGRTGIRHVRTDGTYIDDVHVRNEATGTITGYDGVRFNGYLTVGTIDNAGAIAGTDIGIYIYGGNNTVLNERGGYIGGGGDGIFMGGTTATVENAGTIAGTQYAAEFRAASLRLIIDAGAVFDGKVVGKSTGDNTIELTSGASAGTISGVGSQYRNFQTVTIDSGAAWDIAGSADAFGTVTIDGFNRSDRLDLTGLAFDAGDTATFDGNSDVLTIADGAGDTLASIHFGGGIGGDVFQLLDDEHGGTFVEETAPCYLKGTLIRTPEGDRPVETLRIGELILTANGEARPLKWIGRRFYRDWLAVGNVGVQPICFRAGSIGDHVPARDLYVSPEHAMFLDGMLVPACHLVNGVSILKVGGMEEIAYFHLEFDRHAVILAEGAEAESFADDDSRMLFHNADEYRRLYPNETARNAPAEFCAPRLEHGPALDTLRRGLAARAARLRPDGTAASSLQCGNVEIATPWVVSGWAFAGGDTGPVTLALLVNGAVVARTVADLYRADLDAMGIGDGCHAFRFALPPGLAPDIGHRVEVRRETDWSLLASTPVTIFNRDEVPRVLPLRRPSPPAPKRHRRRSAA